MPGDKTVEKARILVIDDEQVIRDVLQKSLERNGYVVEAAENGESALDKIKHTFFNVLITDLKMPKVSGMEVLRDIKALNPFIEVIVVTGYPTVESAVEAIKIGAFDYLSKPFDIADILGALKRCLDRQKFMINHIELNELMILVEISNTFNVIIGFDALIERILESALALVGASRGSVMLVDDISGELYIKASRGMSREVMESTRVKIGEQICGKVAFKKSPFLVRNIELDPEFKMPNKQQYETKSFISMPLLGKVSASEEKVLGVLNITDKVSGGSFTERDYTLLFVLCGQAVAAIENRNLYGDLEDKTELLNRNIKELNNIQSQLIQSEKMAVVGHIAYGITREINNPLQMLLDSLNTLGTTWEDHVKVDRSAMEVFKRTLTRANTVITDLFKFVQISKQEFQTVNICGIADEALSLLETQYDIKNIRIKKEYADDTLLFSADPEMLRQMVFNLCLNSVEAMPQGGDLILRIFVPPGKKDQEGTPGIVLEVEDTGIGIPEEIMVRIFNPFFTTKEDKGCMGLGLSIVHLILEKHHALVNVESIVNKGTRFTVIFPGSYTESIPGLLSSRNI